MSAFACFNETGLQQISRKPGDEPAGFAMLLKGCFQAIRDPRAHEPKILWKGEDDAADYLTLISLLHRKLDEAACVPPASGKP